MVAGMAEYIEREADIEAIMCEPPDAHYPQWYADKIKEIQTADVAKVRHGFWCWITEDIYRCDNCGEMSHVKEVMGEPDWKYCPNCGCLMGGGDDE